MPRTQQLPLDGDLDRGASSHNNGPAQNAPPGSLQITPLANGLISEKARFYFF